MKLEKQLQTVDRSAPASMKNAANCVNQCELQDTLIIDVSNAHGGLGSLPGPRPVEGRFLPKRKFARVTTRVSVGSSSFFLPEAVSETECWSEKMCEGRVALMPREFFPSLVSFPPRALGGRSLISGRPPHGAQRSGLGAGVVPLASRSPLSSPLLASFTRPQLGRDDPLNLSILLRGGKENNDDSLSKGD